MMYEVSIIVPRSTNKRDTLLAERLIESIESYVDAASIWHDGIEQSSAWPVDGRMIEMRSYRIVAYIIDQADVADLRETVIAVQKELELPILFSHREAETEVIEC